MAATELLGHVLISNERFLHIFLNLLALVQFWVNLKH